MKVILLIILGGLMHAAQAFAPEVMQEAAVGSTAMTAGYLLITGFLAGHLFHLVGLPKLTGYLASGIIVGPQVLGFISTDVLESLQIFNGVAIALIALTAGAEMHLKSLKPLFKSIFWITLIAIIGTTGVLVLVAFALHDFLPFMHDLSLTQQVAAAGVLGVTMVAQSPAVIVALRDETAADGPMIQTVLALVVLADVVVILMFAVASTVAQASFGASANVSETALNLAREIFGSATIGVVAGFFLSIYLKYVKGGGALFVVAIAFIMAEVGQRMHFDPLLIALAAGMFIRNATTVSERLHHELEHATFPVYIAFFAVTGAGVHLDALALVLIPAFLFVASRGVSFWIGTHVATKIAKSPPVVRKYAAFGLMPQAGLALALAILFQRLFPHLGAEAAALVFGVVALNELIAPVLFKTAIVRSGEAGKLQKPGTPQEAKDSQNDPNDPNGRDDFGGQSGGNPDRGMGPSPSGEALPST